MADANLRTLATEPIRTSDVLAGFDPSETDAAVAARTDTLSEIISTIFTNPPSSLTSPQQAALRTLIGINAALAKTLYESNADTNAYTDSAVVKLAGIFAAANLLIPYKIGNIYRAFAVGESVVKPGNNEGTITASGITVAPVGWQLTRPEATEALPYVYDCHVYGYATNGVFGWQFGTPNRTDRYMPVPTVRFGIGIPAADLGANGDLYIDTAAGNFYTRPAGTWALHYTDKTATGGTGISEAAANNLIQAALTAAVENNTETGIVVTHNADGTIDFVVSGGGTPAVTDDIYFGLSADDTPLGSELTIPAANGVGTIPAFTDMYMLIARLATEGDITSVVFSDDQSQTNQIGAFTKHANTVVPTGETEVFSVWVSNQMLTQPAEAQATVG